MRIICSVLLVSFFSLTTIAATKTINLTAIYDVNSEHENIDTSNLKKEGWIKTMNQYGESKLKLSVKLKTSALPFKRIIGPAFLSISKAGLLNMGISVSDGDASAETTLQLPAINGEFSKLPGLTLVSSGGNYASGTWSFTGKVTIRIE